MAEGILKLGEGQWGVKDGNLLLDKEVAGNHLKREFTVTRGTRATYVGRDGLIKESNLQDTNLVQNGDFSELGDEEITNGGFDTSIAIGSAGSGWKRIINGDNTVEYGGGGVVLTRGSNSSTNECKLYAQTPTASSNILTVGKFYKLTYTVVNNTNVTLLKYYIGGSYDDVPHSVGTHIHYFEQASNQLSIFWNQTTSSSITLDNISVQQVDPNDRWSFSNVGGTHGWRIVDGKAICDTNAATENRNLTSSLSLDNGKTYKLTLDILQSTDNITVYVGGTALSATLPTGENLGYEYYISSADHSGGVLMFYAGSSDLQEIDNISLKEIKTDTPRIDFTDNTDGHLLLEPESRNLVPYSENFEGGSWTNESIGTTPTLEGGYTAPDGSNSAYKISNANQDSFWYYPSVADSDDSRTIWARTVSGTGTAQLTSHNSNTNNTFNLTETWQRFEVNSTTSSTGQTSFYAVDFRGSGTLTELLLWGAQLEDLPYATSYIPTNGSTVTRDGETCTGAGEAQDFNSEEGTFYVDVAALNSSPGEQITISLSGGNSNDRLLVYSTSGGGKWDSQFRKNSANVVSINKSATVSNQSKVAVTWAAGRHVMFVDGVKATVYGVGSETTSTTFDAGDLKSLQFSPNKGTTTNSFYGKVKAIRVYKEALSDSELKTLTS